MLGKLTAFSHQRGSLARHCYDRSMELLQSQSSSTTSALVIRESHRARRLTLRVHETAQVEVVVPRGLPRRLVDRFIAEHQDWIAVRVAKAQARAQAAEAFPPAAINLIALGEQWSLQHQPGEGLLRVQACDESLLRVSGRGSPAQYRAALCRWLSKRAREVLEPWLSELAAEHGFVHGPVQIRLQRSRWGSCSAKGAISLNLALLFQPPAVLRYVLLHELAHTRHLNHSRAFWAVVAACEPDYKRLDRQLRSEGWRNVPAWVRPQGRLLA